MTKLLGTASQLLVALWTCGWVAVAAQASTYQYQDDSSIVSSKAVKVPNTGILQYHYYPADNGDNACEALVMINVGTAMSVGDYTNLGRASAAAAVGNEEDESPSSIVAVIIDTNPGHIQKQSGTRYANFANAIVQDLSKLIPVCGGTNPPNIFLGGHSGGGQGAVEALALPLTFSVAGFIGLVPYEIDTKKMTIPVPGLMWGFSRESCSVDPTKAAEAAYQIVSDPVKRVFYQVQTHNQNKRMGGPHCSFANQGCSIIRMCSGGQEYKWIPNDVGTTIHIFVNTLATKSDFTLTVFNTLGRDDVVVYVGSDSLDTAQS